ncbi:MAG: 2-phospho-L-lactate transferase CofD family protein [Candidatus Paceibacterota bacterium]
MNVVLFTGGRGNANLINYIKDLSYVNLSLLINGYDDGLSTGTIRSANMGMLGPSDYRKNFTNILDSFSTTNLNIKKIFDYRISKSECRLLLKDHHSLLDKILYEKRLDARSEKFIRTYFSLGTKKLLTHTKEIDLLNDFSVGNIIIGGLYDKYQDFNAALKVLTDFFDLNARLINVSIHDDSKLVAFDKKMNFLSNEADIVNYREDEPLKDFYLLSLSRFLKLDKEKDYKPNGIEALSIVPEISTEAKDAILNADLILFGTGTLFSSLLPSYRICRYVIKESKARKVLIVNNDYDNDIKNIRLDEYTHLILREFETQEISFFDRIIADNHSAVIQQGNDDYSNLIKANVANPNRKHNGYRLWSTITKSLDQIDGKCRVKIIHPDEMSDQIKKIYQEEIDVYNGNSIGEIEFSFGDENATDYNYYLILDTSGKINLHDIENWIQFANKFNFSCIFGSRFYSRKQLIFSFKKKLVESKSVYLLSMLTSNIVSFFYFLRFFNFVADPFSGIYLMKADKDYRYKGVSNFLKYINKNKIEILSLPITYRTYKNVDYMKKSVTTIKNILKLFIYKMS